MRTFDSATSAFGRAGPIEVARWEQYQLGDRLPFDAMWYTVPPGASSERDCHPEPEFSIVVAGSGFVETAGRLTEVATGTAFLLGSEEAHVIHNRATEVPLTIFSAYWMPPETGQQDAAETGREPVASAGQSG